MGFEYKVWGQVCHIFDSKKAAVSHLRVDAGYRCSQHYHKERANQFTVLTGSLLIEEWPDWKLGDPPPLDSPTVTLLSSCQSHVVHSGVLHRFVVIHSGDVIEIYWPDNGGEVKLDDIVRLDEGGRVERI